MLHQNTRELETFPFPIAAALTNFQEGVGLTFIQESGQAVVTIPSSAASTDKFAGVSRSQWNTPTTGVYLETVTVPSSSPYTVTMSKAMYGTSQMYAYNATAGSAMTVTTSSPSAGEIRIASGSTTATFNSAQAGATVNLQYRYSLTAAEAVALVGDGIPGRSPPQVTGKLDVIRRGFVFTDQFDAATNWAGWAAGAITVGVVITDNGLFDIGTLASAGANVPNAIVTNIPTTDLPFLGLYFAC